MPKPFPAEFRRDVIAVARQGDQSIAQVARCFGASESCLSRWLRIADREDGISTDTTATAAPVRADGDLEAENRELCKRDLQRHSEGGHDTAGSQADECRPVVGKPEETKGHTSADA